MPLKKTFFVLNQLEFSLTWLGLALQSAVLPKPLNYPRRLSHLEIPDCCCRFVTESRPRHPHHHLHHSQGPHRPHHCHLARLTLVLSCAMNFKNYPHDEQLCNLKIESSKFSSKCGSAQAVNLISYFIFLHTEHFMALLKIMITNPFDIAFQYPTPPTT